MNLFTYKPFYNFIWYQAIWFIAILNGNSLQWLLGLLIVLHVMVAPSKKQEMIVLLGGASMGILADSLLAKLGFYQFPVTMEPLSIPFWLIAVWVAFCGTLRHSLAFMTRHPILMTLVASFAAPLSYLAAARLGAVEFPYGSLNTALAVGACWACITPILLTINNLANQLFANNRLHADLGVKRALPTE